MFTKYNILQRPFINNKIFKSIISRNIFNYADPFLLDNQLSDEEKSIKELANNFSKDILLPNIVSSFRNETFDKNILKEMGNIGLLGPTISGYGCAGVNYVSYGLIMREIISLVVEMAVLVAMVVTIEKKFLWFLVLFIISQ